MAARKTAARSQSAPTAAPAETQTPSAGKPGSQGSAAERTTAAPEATSRGHVVRDGDVEALALPREDVSNVVVTDRTTGAVAPASSYDVDGARVVKRAGVWARGTRRWLVEYDRG